MALYPGEETERRIGADLLRSEVTRIFRACGMEEADAGLLADSLVHADLRGIHSHGVLRVSDYVKKLTEDGVNPRGVPRIVSDKGAALVIDADNAMGQIAGSFAMKAAIARAREIGVAFAGVRGSNHCGALDYFTMMALEASMIGIAGTNALPTMAPWGGTDKIVGLNPISAAIPGGEAGPLVLDVALGATAHGKIRVYAQKGQPIPEGWAFDAEGNATTDPIAALAGLIQPIGAHKGIGLAMVVGILSSVLPGAHYGTWSGNMIDGAVSGADGQFYIAIDVAAFRDVAGFRADMDKITRQYNATALAPGTSRVYVPGALESQIAERNASKGIPINDETIAGIEHMARKVGLDITL